MVPGQRTDVDLQQDAPDRADQAAENPPLNHRDRGALGMA